VGYTGGGELGTEWAGGLYLVSEKGCGAFVWPACFRRLCRKRRRAPITMRAITAMPPTTPPTMAPMGALDDEDDEDGLGAGDVGLLIGAGGGLLTLVDTSRLSNLTQSNREVNVPDNDCGVGDVMYKLYGVASDWSHINLVYASDAPRVWNTNSVLQEGLAESVLN
jgi:hypothetical protein